MSKTFFTSFIVFQLLIITFYPLRLWPCQSQDPCLGWCFLRLWHFLLPLRPVWFWRGKNAFCRYLGMVYICLIHVLGFCFWTFIIHHTICIYWCFLNLDRLLLFIFPTLLWRWKPGSVEHWWQEREAGAIEGAISPISTSTISTSTISASKSASWHQAGLRYLMFAHNYLNFRNYIKGRYDSLNLSLDEYQVRVSTKTKSKEKSKPVPLVTAGSDWQELVVDNSHRRGSRRLPVV